MTDTSTEAVERFTYSLHSLAQYEYLPDVDREVYGEAINLIRSLVAERDALRAERGAAVAAAYADAAEAVWLECYPSTNQESLSEMQLAEADTTELAIKAIQANARAAVEEKNDDE